MQLAPPTVYNERGLRVDLVRGLDVLETVYSDINGDFVCSNVGGPSDVRLMLTLEDRDNIIKTYDNTRDANNPSWLRTPTFHVERPYRANIAMNIAIDHSITYELNGVLFVPMMPDDTNVGADRFVHLAVIHHNVYTAVLFAVGILKLTLDHALPVEVRAFSAVSGTFYNPPDSTINIDIGDSDWNDDDAPDNREWHEFAHHIMTDSAIGGDNHMPEYIFNWWFLADLDGDLLPETPVTADRDINHWGYINPSTTDSWVEGFATFISVVMADTMTDDEFPWIYDLQGGAVNLEDPIPADHLFVWGDIISQSDEELAIAAILWDLYDPDVDSYNMSALFGWSQYQGEHLVLDDRIDLSLNEIWNQLHGLAPTNLTGVYNAFAYLGALDSDGDGINDLDELFILHGAFVDSNQTGQYDGEEVGRAAYTDPQVTWRNLTGSRRLVWRDANPNRTAKPPYPGSFINLTAVNGETGQQLDSAELLVQIVYDPPYESHNYNYTASLSELPADLFITLPILPSKAYIYAEKRGYDTSEPLMMNSTFYWDAMSQPGDTLLNHTFYLQPSHDIAVTNITTYKTVVGQNYPLRVNITIENQGLFFNETFNVTVYANTTIIGAQPVTLAAGNSTTITITCNTTDLAKGNYTITAHAIPVSGEKDLIDNNRTADSMVKIGVPGDLNNDNKCNILDLVIEAGKFGAVKGDPDPSKPKYDPNYDLNDDEKINILDLVKLAGHFGTTDP